MPLMSVLVLVFAVLVLWFLPVMAKREIGREVGRLRAAFLKIRVLYAPFEIVSIAYNKHAEISAEPSGDERFLNNRWRSAICFHLSANNWSKFTRELGAQDGSQMVPSPQTSCGAARSSMADACLSPANTGTLSVVSLNTFLACCKADFSLLALRPPRRVSLSCQHVFVEHNSFKLKPRRRHLCLFLGFWRPGNLVFPAATVCLKHTIKLQVESCICTPQNGSEVLTKFSLQWLTTEYWPHLLVSGVFNSPIEIFLKRVSRKYFKPFKSNTFMKALCGSLMSFQTMLFELWSVAEWHILKLSKPTLLTNQSWWQNTVISYIYSRCNAYSDFRLIESRFNAFKSEVHSV